MKDEILTIDVEKLRRAFQTAFEMHFNSYPHYAMIESFMHIVRRDALVSGRDIVGAERERLLKGGTRKV